VVLIYYAAKNICHLYTLGEYRIHKKDTLGYVIPWNKPSEDVMIVPSKDLGKFYCS